VQYLGLGYVLLEGIIKEMVIKNLLKKGYGSVVEIDKSYITDNAKTIIDELEALDKKQIVSRVWEYTDDPYSYIPKSFQGMT